MKWDYMTEFLIFVQDDHSPEAQAVREETLDTLNKRGTEGWELTGVLPLNSCGGSFFFKRPKSKSDDPRGPGRRKGVWNLVSPSDVRKFQEDHQVPLAEIARALGVTAPTIRNWLDEKNAPPPQMQKLIADLRDNPELLSATKEVIDDKLKAGVTLSPWWINRAIRASKVR